MPASERRMGVKVIRKGAEGTRRMVDARRAQLKRDLDGSKGSRSRIAWCIGGCRSGRVPGRSWDEKPREGKPERMDETVGSRLPAPAAARKNFLLHFGVSFPTRSTCCIHRWQLDAPLNTLVQAGPISPYPAYPRLPRAAHLYRPCPLPGAPHTCPL